MSKKSRVQYSLDSGEIKQLNPVEIVVILRAADEIISTGGRSILAKTLKGSKDKKVLEHKLDECPSYGYYKELSIEEITKRIDWMIQKGYLRIEYSGRLPMLVFSDKGWEIEKNTFTTEIYYKFVDAVNTKDPSIVFQMKDVNRTVVFGVLDKIRESRDKSFLVLLEAWKMVEVRKVRERIDMVMKSLNAVGHGFTVIEGGKKTEN
ncbi:MAG: RQC-minor-1 family DNA-binding protein [Anaerocolumna sp.]